MPRVDEGFGLSGVQAVLSYTTPSTFISANFSIKEFKNFLPRSRLLSRSLNDSDDFPKILQAYVSVLANAVSLVQVSMVKWLYN